MESTNNTNNRYNSGKIYMITDNAYTEKYIGSTVRSLSGRMSSHRSKYKAFLIGKHHYVTVFKLFNEYGTENCKIELLQEVPCQSKEQLRQVEGDYIRKMICVNKVIENRSISEWREDNKDRLMECKKIYRQEHAEDMKKYKSVYRQEHRAK